MAVWIVQFSSRLFLPLSPSSSASTKNQIRIPWWAVVVEGRKWWDYINKSEQKDTSPRRWEMVRIRPNLRLRPRVHNFVGEWMAVICFDKTRKQRHFQFEFRCVNLKSGPFFQLCICIGRVGNNLIQYDTNFSWKGKFSCFMDYELLLFTISSR